MNENNRKRFNKSVIDVNTKQGKRQHKNSHSPVRNNQHGLTPFEEEVLNVSLTEAYNKDDLTDEEAVYKFFRNINMLPEKKDYFIKDFEDFYFKIRPKLSSKLIKVLLEGDFKNGIQGLLFLISEIDES